MPKNLRTQSLLVVLTLGLAVPVVPQHTLAATVLHLSSPELTHRATEVLEGIVVDSVTRRGTDGEMRRYTRIRSERWWKDSGTRPEIITVRQLCGGEACTPIPGDARFRKNEPVLVFLRAENTRFAGDYFVVGMAQGKFSIQERNGRKFLTRDIGNLKFVYKSSQENQKIPAATSFPPDYAEFVAALRATLKSAPTSGGQP